MTEQGLDLLHLTGDFFKADLGHKLQSDYDQTTATADREYSMRPSNIWPAPADRSNWLRPKGQFKKRPHRRSNRELGVDAGRISKWKQRGKKSDLPLSATLTQEQQEIRRLQRELREAQLERTSPGATS